MTKPLKISEQAAVQMPMKTVASLIMLVAIGTWAYFGLHETLNAHSTKIELMQKDLEQNSEFRIKYPRGELGQSSGEAELFMLVEHLAGLLEDIDAEVSRLRLRHILLEKAIAQLEYAAGVEIEKDYSELIQKFKD